MMKRRHVYIYAYTFTIYHISTPILRINYVSPASNNKSIF
jgi:hypothetical protein